MSEWQPYPRNRKILCNETYAVIVPASYVEAGATMPLFCGVCGIRFGHKEDEKAYQKFKCCSSCADTWAYSHKEKWDAGWRPAEEQVKKAIEKRSVINPDLVFE